MVLRQVCVGVKLLGKKKPVILGSEEEVRRPMNEFKSYNKRQKVKTECEQECFCEVDRSYEDEAILVALYCWGMEAVDCGNI